MMEKNRKWFGFFGFIGFQGIAGIINHDWTQAVWVVWFVWFIYFFIDKKERDEIKGGFGDLNEKRKEEKEANLNKVMEMFKTKNVVVNDDVQNMLNVSDATAENYLDELEKRGKIEQVGRTGQSVSYRLKNF